MSDSAKRFAPDITVKGDYLVRLKSLEHAAYLWGLAANGKRQSYNHPIGRMMARDMTKDALDRYFDAIEKIIPKRREGEIA